jgi:hypothetical protein
MKKPPKEILEELKHLPYKSFDGVDYKRIMSMKYPAIRIDVRNEDSKNASTDGTVDQNMESGDESDDG